MNASRSPVVSTKEGQVQGLVEGPVFVFKGIPYAQPPVGNLRWRPPLRALPWRHILDASQYGPSSMQSRQACIESGGGDPGEPDENCLHLNVWTPKLDAGAKLPVVVWIHGGAFVLGASRFEAYDGSPLAMKDTVVVTLNYRLGHLGFFAHPKLQEEQPNGPANFGLLDQMLALEWVKDNIALFGGDAGNVTLMGESAGAKSVLALYCSPLMRGRDLFHRGVAMSSYVLAEKPLADARYCGEATAQRLGLDWHEVSMEKLRGIPAERFWPLPSDVNNAPSPIAGDSVLPLGIRETFQAGGQLDLPLIIGSTTDDSSVVTSFGIDPATILEKLGGFADSIRELYGAELGDREIGRRMCRDFVFTVLPRYLATLHASRNNPVWRYSFDYTAELLRPRSPDGVRHGQEIPYFLGTTEVSPPNQGFMKEKDKLWAGHMLDTIVRFARGEKPGHMGGVEWQEHTVDADRLLRLAPTVTPETDFDKVILDAATLFMPLIDAFARPKPPKMPRGAAAGDTRSTASTSTAAKNKGRPQATP
ncbi:carboxylesterase/lipase family protein [Myxococcus faecalis]|uniref:carboxylesterase/lipase family protein n=1 Tax=Myxococcus faecalis TaxID=3115646 RepID=UPI003CE9248A